MNEFLLNKLSASHARVDSIILFQGLDMQSGILEEMLEKCDEDYLKRILGIQKVPEDEAYLWDLIEKHFKGWFVAEVHTPFDVSDVDLMWSHTVFTVLRGKNIEQLIENACIWAREKQRELSPNF